MNFWRCSWHAGLLGSAVVTLLFGTAGGKELYAIYGNVYGIDLDGSNPQLIAYWEPHCRYVDISVSSVAGAVYWAQRCAGFAPTIFRKKPGQPVEAVVHIDGVTIHGLVADDSTGRLYYAIHTRRQGSPKNLIESTDLEGQKVITQVDWGLPGFIVGIDVDPVARQIYWCSFEGSICRTKLDGFFPPEELVSGLQDVFDLELDIDGGKMYWGDYVGGDSLIGRIVRADLDGRNIETLFQSPDSFPEGLAIDKEARKLYWSDTEAGVVWKSDLDGSNREVALETQATRIDLGSLGSVAINEANWGQLKRLFR